MNEEDMTEDPTPDELLAWCGLCGECSKCVWCGLDPESAAAARAEIEDHGGSTEGEP